MFKFGFSKDNDDSDTTGEVEEHHIQWLESQEIKPNGNICADNFNNISSIQCGDYDLKYLSDKDVIQSLRTSQQEITNNSLLNAEQNHSDLITAVYEGGLKIWECTFDLLQYLDEQNIDLVGKKVLDLGCGAGIIGIYSCLKGSKTVFQDYNPEVIKSSTILNVSLNNISFDKCEFYCGDWESFLDSQTKILSENEKFDFIFTSETIYNTDNYKKILKIFHQLLQKNGVIYLAAKAHYFGVGGGIGQFEEMLNKEDKFNHAICWTCPNGVKRAIIKITLR